MQHDVREMLKRRYTQTSQVAAICFVSDAGHRLDFARHCTPPLGQQAGHQGQGPPHGGELRQAAGAAAPEFRKPGDEGVL
jgi:hypothetical protein